VEIDAKIVIEKLRARLSDLEWKNVLLEAELEQLKSIPESPEENSSS
jgi:hypothetical protein